MIDSTGAAYLLRTNSGTVHLMTRGSLGYALCGRFVTGIMVHRGEITCSGCTKRHAAGATEPRRATARRRLASQLADPHNH